MISDTPDYIIGVLVSPFGTKKETNQIHLKSKTEKNQLD